MKIKINNLKINHLTPHQRKLEDIINGKLSKKFFVQKLNKIIYGTIFIFTFISLSNIISIETMADWPLVGQNNGHTGFFGYSSNNNLTDYHVINKISIGTQMVYTQPILIDINSDDYDEIIVSMENLLVCLDHSGKSIWELLMPNLILTTPTSYLLDDNGNYGFLLGCLDGCIYALNSKGKILWNFASSSLSMGYSGGIYSCPMIADIENDGEREIIVGTPNDYVICLHINGTLKWKLKLDTTVYPLGISGTPTLLDCDNDNIMEIFIGGNYRFFYAIKLVRENNGSFSPSIKWKYDTGCETLAVLAAPIVTDLNTDGEKEIIIGTKANSFLCFDINGRVIWKFITEGPIYTTCSIGDINKDGRIEIIFGSYDKHIYILNAEGKLINKIDTIDPVTSQIILCNLDGDPQLELIVTTILKQKNPAIGILKYDGRIGTMISYANNGDISQLRAVNIAVSDINNDTCIEIVFGTMNGNVIIISTQDQEKPGNKKCNTLFYSLAIIFISFLLIYFSFLRHNSRTHI